MSRNVAYQSMPARRIGAGFVIPIPLSTAWWGRRFQRRVDVAFERAHVWVQRPLPGTCPSCGARMQVPSGTVCLECPYCDATVLAAEGMLIEWEDSDASRAERWKTQAAVLAERLEEKVRGRPLLGLQIVYGVWLVLKKRAG